MNYLFDVSPLETDESKQKRGRRRDAAAAATAERTISVDLKPRSPASHGCADDDGHVCPDERCQGTAHDITHVAGGSWRIECAFCGTGQWVKASKTDAVFRFPGGIFDGLTIEEASREKNGLEYIRFVSKRDPNPVVREACSAWLDSEAGSP